MRKGSTGVMTQEICMKIHTVGVNLVRLLEEARIVPKTAL